MARELRETGAVNIYGVFPRNLLTKEENSGYRGGWTDLFGFLKGSNIDLKSIDNQIRVGLYDQYPLLRKAGALTDIRFDLQKNTHRQIWLTGNLPWNRYDAYGIGKGEFPQGQVRALHMPILSPDMRSGTYDIFKLVGPGDLVRRIDEEIEKSPYFPDALFRHVYPNMVGPNRDKNITRIKATELQVLEFDRKTEQVTSRIFQYPQPILY